MSLPDISHRFAFKPRWRQGGFEYEEISGELGEPGKVMTHRSINAQRTMSRGTGEHAGHRIGIQFGTPGDARNLSLQNPNSNTFAPKALQEAFRGPGGSYHDLESQWALRLQQGYRIKVIVRDKYRIGEERPISRYVEWTETDPKGRIAAPQRLDFGNFSSPQKRAADQQ
jgi:hypothetical protein